MISLLHTLQRLFRPDLNNRQMPGRYLLMSDVVGVLYGIPLSIIGLVWLVSVTEWIKLVINWRWMVVILIAIIIFSRLRFYVMHALHDGHMVGSDGDFSGVVLWASLLVFGPTILWLFLLWIVLELWLVLGQTDNRDRHWDSVRSASLNAASLILPSLIALQIYQHLGGLFPIAGLGVHDLLAPMAAVLSFAVFYFLTWLPFIAYVVWVQKSKFDLENPASIFWFTVATMELPFISLPFGVLASGLFVAHGPVILAIYFLGLFLIALLANQLSQSAEKNRRQAVQLMGLETLGRDILAGHTDARNLPSILRKNIPKMFPCQRAAVWIAPETHLLKYPDGRDTVTPAIWDWLLTQTEPQGFLETADLPWEERADRHFALLTTPILDPLSGEPIGGLFVELQSLPQKWDKKTLQEHFPALRNLAAQIAMALQQAENYHETLKHQRINQELRLAGDIQLSFLPDHTPEIPGWDIAASLMPARQTSGDFYDFFMLDEDRLGIIIADVADKGLGAALYMALGRTLLLTYAQAYPDNPAAVLQATNQRMLSDARAQMFITAFYGVLDPASGRLLYCNAGHHPPLLIRDEVRKLNPNGMALGIDENAAWVAISQQIDIDDTLVLYTDGVVEASNPTGEFYGMQNLINTANSAARRPSPWVIRSIWEDVLNFQGEATQSDDITLVCIRRRE